MHQQITLECCIYLYFSEIYIICTVEQCQNSRIRFKRFKNQGSGNLYYLVCRSQAPPRHLPQLIFLPWIDYRGVRLNPPLLRLWGTWNSLSGSLYRSAALVLLAGSRWRGRHFLRTILEMKMKLSSSLTSMMSSQVEQSSRTPSPSITACRPDSCKIHIAFLIEPVRKVFIYNNCLFMYTKNYEYIIYVLKTIYI